MYLQAKRIMGLAKDQGKAMHRTKRGWMWNQFFLLEEYTGPDTQYVGKVSIAIKRLFSNVIEFLEAQDEGGGGWNFSVTWNVGFS